MNMITETWAAMAGAFLTATVLPAVIILVIGILGVRLVLALTEAALKKTKLEKAAYTLIKTALRVVLYGLLALTVASKLGIDVTGVVALASVLTLAVSLSVQNALTNVISGFTLLYTKPFVSGDFVEIAMQSGTVQEIGLTYTRLATPDNKCISIPNSSVTAAQIVNYTVLGQRRMSIPVSASYETPVELVLQTLRQAGAVEGALEDPAPVAVVERYGESAIEYSLRVWSSADDYWDVYYAITGQLQALFSQQGVEITYPHLNIHMK